MVVSHRSILSNLKIASFCYLPTMYFFPFFYCQHFCILIFWIYLLERFCFIAFVNFCLWTNSIHSYWLTSLICLDSILPSYPVLLICPAFAEEYFFLSFILTNILPTLTLILFNALFGIYISFYFFPFSCFSLVVALV